MQHGNLQVQLEVDHTESGKPTDYEHLLLAQTIALCQRYYYRTADDGNTTNIIQTGVESSNIATGGVPHPTRMRVYQPLLGSVCDFGVRQQVM